MTEIIKDLSFITTTTIVCAVIAFWFVFGIYIWLRAYRRQYVHKGIFGWIFGIAYAPTIIFGALVAIVGLVADKKIKH